MSDQPSTKPATAKQDSASAPTSGEDAKATEDKLRVEQDNRVAAVRNEVRTTAADGPQEGVNPDG